ncbi:hypothetical protein GIB67_012446 [Kingdonia uniflora]|uniref:Uncharacterized protein n=1 Tax=Kingdonia uniflora TaxID=39325 RepID=A0A7J7MI81_9MAGN|nr:hypothetical protein GIB67_002643 [Kingdonia uniflora]KAF6161619.1 hypothetical protein GIB67_012446 [Kingdonia uniflora]
MTGPVMRRDPSPIIAKVMFLNCAFYRAKGGKMILKKSSMSPLNLFHKIMKRVTFGNSHNQMGRVICPYQLLLHRLELDLNVDRC